MSRRAPMRRMALISGAVLAAMVIVVALPGTPAAHADTDTNSLVGEGGSFISPITNLLLNSDAGLQPLYASYSDSNLDNAIADFDGGTMGSFAADFVVTERPLTSAESTLATGNGRTFAYVPFAATPVAIAAFALCTPSDLASGVISPTTFCEDLPLTPTQVGQIFTYGSTDPDENGASSLPTAYTSWSQLNQANGQPIPDTSGIGLASTLQPSAENTALMALMDSDPTAKALLDNALNNPNITPTSRSDTPSEIWPFHGVDAFIGGDEGLLGKELSIVATTNAPSFLGTWGALTGGGGAAHNAFPLSAVWTGSPLGTPWNVPTAAIENADSAFVGPTVAAATAAQSGSGTTLDPTSNLVTFNPQPTNTAAYNNYLMVESYLVVPTTGLLAEKAVKLAQFIRYILGPTGQLQIQTLGAAAATPAEVTAGLNVASELDAEAITSAAAAAAADSSTSSSTTTTVPGAGGPGAAATFTGDTGNTGTGATSGLAVTGGNPLPLVILGAVLFVAAGAGRRRLKRRVRGLRAGAGGGGHGP